jgi:hypothetical protein
MKDTLGGALVVLVIGGFCLGTYLYTNRTSEITEETKIQTLSPIPTPAQEACADFNVFSDYVLKTIEKPLKTESINPIEPGYTYRTHFLWRRYAYEPFISYPLIKGTRAVYISAENYIENDIILEKIKESTERLSETIDKETFDLGFSREGLNIIPTLISWSEK